MSGRLPLAWKMLLREWRGGELGLLFAALVLGVSLVTGISLFAERLHNALVGEASVYLGADRVLQVSEPARPGWLEQARDDGLSVARTVLFPTMVYPVAADSERTVLSALKAVSAGYPLRGDLEIQDAQGRKATIRQGPPPGEAWVDANILAQLDITLGDEIDIGNSRFQVSHVLTREGDAGSSFYGMGSRVMISDSELPATGLVIPGSRVEYRYLFAGAEENLTRYFDWLSPQLDKGTRIITLQDNQPGIAGALDKASTFLLLAGSLAVMLAALAAAFAAQRYFERHRNTVAVLKTLGTGRPQILALMTGQMTILWLAATTAGIVLGSLLQLGFLKALADWVPENLPTAGFKPYLVGGTTALICLLAFVCPPFWRLAGVPPWQVLRSDTTSTIAYGHSLWPILPGIGALLLLYSNNFKLAGLLVLAAAALLLPATLLGWIFLRSGRALGQRLGSLWRLGIANVLRRRWLSLLQVVIFGIGFMLLAVMFLLRSSLLQEWKMQIPADAPNVFLINISPSEVDNLRGDLSGIGLATAGMYPMVRGRLTGINGQVATELFDESVGEVYRELNLSWSATLPADNAVASGEWPGSARNDLVPVSIEQGLAKRLAVTVGDELTFSIGGTPMKAHIASIRILDWDKMTPNFYFLFTPGVLQSFNTTWMTSLYRNEQQETSLSRLLRHYPSVSAYPVDDLIARIQTIVQRASLAVEIILLLVLLAGMLVMVTCLKASMDQRLHESALLRTLGAGKQLVLGSLAIEFAFIGLAAGLIASFGAELTAWMLQVRLFRMEAALHPTMWLVLPAVTTLLVGFVGTVFSYRAVAVPPMLILRESNGQG